MAFADTQKLTVQLDLAGNFQAKLSSAARALQGFDRSTSRTQQSLQKFGRNLERGIVLGGAAAAGGFLAVTKAAGDFEAQLNTIATIVNRNDIPKIGEDLRKTARETGLSLDDLTTAYYDLASAGVKGQLATDALNDAVKLGIGGLATTAETVDLLTTAINAYGLDSKGAAKATDQFALAVQDGKVKASEIAASFADVASIAKTYKVGIDQIAASYAFLTAQGVPAGEVTTEMQRAIVSLINPSKELETAQKKLGISFTKEIATKGLVGALQELRVYSDKTGIPLIALLGRIEAVKYTLQTTGPNFRGFNAELDRMGDASGTAAKQMAERQQGLNFQLAILKANLKDAAITIGSALLPKLTPLVQKLNAFIGGNQAKISEFAGKLADGFSKVADAVQKVDWSPFIDGLKLSGEIAKDVIGAFRSLPADLQKLVVAGFALNKVTGGLGTSLIKDIGGAIIGNLAQRGSTPANPLFVVDISGGAGGAVAAAGTAAAGAALPIAVIAASIIGPTLVAIKESNDNSALAAGIGESVKNEIAGGASLADLQQSLAAVNTGINDLSNMWGAGLVMGDALDKLEDQKALLQNQIDLMSDTHSETVRIADAAQQNSADTRSEAAAVRAASADQISATKALADTLGGAIEGLKRARTGEDIRAAITKGLAQIGKGRGSLGNTQRLISGLKAQLKNVDDPKLRAELKAAISRVEKRLPAREFAQKELTAANKILHSHESGNKKIADLKAIEQALKDRGLPHAAAVIRQKINEAKHAQVVATNHTTASIKAKRWQFTTNVSVNTQISIRDQIRREHQISRTQTTAS